MKVSATIAAGVLTLGLVAGVGAVPSASATPHSTWCSAHNNVAIIGTSADTGYATSGYASPTDTWYPTTYGWATRFANALHSEWGTNVQNYAHNGAMASDFLPGGRWSDTVGAVADIQAHQPDLVIIDLGGNEYNIQKPPEQFQADLDTLVDNVRAARPGVDILLSIYAEFIWKPNEWSPPTQSYTWADYGAVIYTTAVAKGTALVDMRQYVPSEYASQQPDPIPWSSDGIHLNEAGNLAEFGAFWGWASSLASICG